VRAPAQVESCRRRETPTVKYAGDHGRRCQEEVLDGLQTAEAYGAVSLDAPLSGEDEEESSRLNTIGEDDGRLELVDDQATIFAAARR
jgi:RNA polymerase sigma-B factor